MPIICLDEREEVVDCPRDERPAVGGRSAERALGRAMRDGMGDRKVINRRNGLFTAFSRPQWAMGECSMHVAEYGSGRIDHWQHTRTDEATCNRAVHAFESRELGDPFADIEGAVLCSTYRASICLEMRDNLIQVNEALMTRSRYALEDGWLTAALGYFAISLAPKNLTSRF
jgi:hypothetical protein